MSSIRLTRNPSGRPIDRAAIFFLSLNWPSSAFKLNFRFSSMAYRYQFLPFFLLQPCPILPKLMPSINPSEIARCKLGEKTGVPLGFPSDISTGTAGGIA
jgi:hypothetical protein